VHEEAAGEHSVLPDFADGAPRHLPVSDTAVKANGARRLRQSTIHGVCRWSRRHAAVGVGRGLVLEQTGMDTREIRITVTGHQHKTAWVAEPGSGCTEHHFL